MKEGSLKRFTYCMISFIVYSQKVKTTGKDWWLSEVRAVGEHVATKGQP